MLWFTTCSGPFGACLWHSDQEVLVYVARPGLRLWKASLHGKVVFRRCFVSIVLMYSKLCTVLMLGLSHTPVSQFTDL